MAEKRKSKSGRSSNPNQGGGRYRRREISGSGRLILQPPLTMQDRFRILNLIKILIIIFTLQKKKILIIFILKKINKNNIKKN